MQANITCEIGYIDLMSDESINLAVNINMLMKHYGQTQDQVAKKAGLSQKTISNMVNPSDTKSPTLSSIECVAAAYKLTTCKLISKADSIEALMDGRIDLLMQQYFDATEQTKEALLMVAKAGGKNSNNV